MDVSPASSRTRYTLPARLRVKRAGLFQEAFGQGRKQVGRYLILWSRSGEDAAKRLGVVASRKVGNSVARSRAKRRLRELYRLNQHQISGSEDVILVARHSILNAKPDALRQDFETVFSRAGRWEPLPPSDAKSEPPPTSTEFDS